jgi:hypothetical protein
LARLKLVIRRSDGKNFKGLKVAQPIKIVKDFKAKPWKKSKNDDRCPDRGQPSAQFFHQLLENRLTCVALWLISAFSIMVLYSPTNSLFRG